MLSRRGWMAGAAAGTTGFFLAARADAKTRRKADGDPLSLRGTLSGDEVGLRPGSEDDQSRRFQAAVDRAAREGRALLLGPGRFRVADIELPDRLVLMGVPGETRLVFAGGRRFLANAPDARRLRLVSLAMDGGFLPFGEERIGLLTLSDLDDFQMEDCDLSDSSTSGLVAERSDGHVRHCRVSGVRAVGLWSRDGKGMAFEGNDLNDCGNTGILVSRAEKAEDGALVSGNRVRGVHALSGGTGQNGNGINADRASGVTVTGNRVSDCAFSAIRVFSADNCRIADNTALRSGETALYVEFASEGAVVSGNLVDDAALGISFANFAEHRGRLGVCSGNLIRNIREASLKPTEAISSYGIGIGAEADVAITGNTIENAARVGIGLGWGPYCRDLVATGNLVRDCPTGITVSIAEGAGAVLISGNLVSGARLGAILGQRWDEVATGDLAHEPSPSERVSVSGNLAVA